MNSRRLSLTRGSTSSLLLAVLTANSTAVLWAVPGTARAYGPLPAPAPAAHPATAPASAPGSASPVSAASLAEARLHFQQGVALYQEQNYGAALAEFDAAYAISREPIVLYNMGLTYKALFRYQESVEALNRYLTEGGARAPGISRDKKSEVERLVAEMKSLLADVTIVRQPAGATIRIDGRVTTLGPGGVVQLASGPHVIEASAPDFVAGRREITVVAGTAQTISLVLAAIPRSGHVRVAAAQIGARISIDGRDLGPAPVEADLLAGGHQLDVVAPGFAPSRSELVVAAGQTRELTISLERPAAASEGASPIYHRWWFWVGAGVAAAAVTTTAIVLTAPESTQGPLVGTLGSTSTN